MSKPTTSIAIDSEIAQKLATLGNDLPRLVNQILLDYIKKNYKNVSSSQTELLLGSTSNQDATPKANPKKHIVRTEFLNRGESFTLSEVLSRFSEGPQTGIFTDGCARPNPGPGGWGAVHVIDGKVIQHLYDHSPTTTNNRMELTALIQGYKLLSTSSKIEVFTDSELCVNIINKWATNWKRNGWRKKNGEIANLELVKELYQLQQERPGVNLKWIKAHNGWLWNEYADSLSTAWTREEL